MLSFKLIKPNYMLYFPMKKTLFMSAIITLLLISNFPCQNSYADCSIGITIESQNGNIVIIGFSAISKDENKSPAKKARLKKGDILKEINGTIVSNPLDVHKALKNIFPGATITVKIERSGKEKTCRIKTVKNHRPDVYVIIDILEKGKNVSLAIIVGNVSNAMDTSSFDINEWKSGISTLMVNKLESGFMVYQNRYNNLSLVDRNKIRAILDELNFQSTGYISENTRTKIGKLTGATHIVVADFNRFSNPPGFIDVVSRKLIDIKTGIILASISSQHFYNSNGNCTKIE